MEMDSEHLGDSYESSRLCTLAPLHGKRSHKNAHKISLRVILKSGYFNSGQIVTQVLFNYTDYSHLRAKITFN